MTPLKKWATVNLIFGVISISIPFGILIFVIIIYSAEIDVMKKSILAIYVALVAFMSLINLIVFVASFILSANIAKADTIIGETFLRCPLCFGSNIIFDVKPFRLKGKVLCRDCHAQWEFHLDPFSKSLTRLSIIDYGIALRAEEKSLVPSTDNPEQWHKWAKERFRQRQQISQTAHAPQGQAIFCRFCGHRNPLDAKFCSACGKELQA